MKTFYRKNSFGVGRWSIWQDGNTICFGHSATLDGHMNVQTEEINEGKAGRSIQEQIDLRINSRIGKMLDKGYKESADEAAKAVTNQLGLITPMLAKPLKAKAINRSFIQPKLNGHRCLITNVDGSIVAYSRQGKIIDTMDHITGFFEKNLPEGHTVDGELYIHGEKLQTIASLVKRGQKRSSEVMYYMYDYIMPEEPHLGYGDRYRELRTMAGPVDCEHVAITETIMAESIEHAMEIFSVHLATGYEGSMLRTMGGKYENGKRSSSLLKIKPVYDTEVEVVDIIPGDSGLGVCVCRMDGLNRTFKVTAPGTHPEKIHALENKKGYIGKRMKIEYRELTADGVPFHAAATEWFSSL